MENKSIQNILATVRYATLSTVDDQGYPWAAPVWYVYDQEKLYWWSPKTSQHQQNIQSNGKVFITIFDSSAPEGEGIGVYIRAAVEEVDANDLTRVIKLYNKFTNIFKLNAENCSGSAPTRIYKATPQEFWLNDGKEIDGYWQDFRKEVK